MRRQLLPFVYVPALVAAAFGFSPVANAAAQRTFVASTGKDTNPCTITQPCRGFAAAVANTSAGGEVIVLDSAGYGQFLVTQSVTVAAPTGVYAGISVFAGSGVTVDGSGIKVVLRGLQINGQGGATGIFFQNGSELHVENCTIANMGDNGIDVRAPSSRSWVSDSAIRTSVNSGIYADAIAGSVSVYISRVRMEANAWGVYVRQGAQAMVADSIVTGNSAAGIYFNIDNPASSSIGLLDVERSTITDNGVGIAFSHTATTGHQSFGRINRSAIFTPFGSSLVFTATAVQTAFLMLSDDDVEGGTQLSGASARFTASDVRFFGGISCIGSPSVSSVGDNVGDSGGWPGGCVVSPYSKF